MGIALLMSNPGAALPHFGRDGKDGDTCFLCPIDKCFWQFSPVFGPYVTGFCPLCPLFLKYLNPRYGNCHTCHTVVAAPAHNVRIYRSASQTNICIYLLSRLGINLVVILFGGFISSRDKNEGHQNGRQRVNVSNFV